MKKILWLPGWYPSKINRLAGDFIQRHAIAVSLFQPVTLIYVVKDEKGEHTNDELAETNVRGGLHETIVYYKPFVTGIKPIDKLISSAKYLAIYKKYIAKYIATQGKPILIHVHVPYKAGIIGRLYKRKYGIPLIVTEHWCGYNTLNPDNFFTRNAVFRRLTKKIFQSADMVAAICESNRKELQSLFHIRESLLIHNVADGRLFFFKERKTGLPFTFIHVSSLTSQKNVEGILSAFAILKNNFQDWRCIIVGAANAVLKEQASHCGLENYLEWTGELPYELVAQQLNRADSMVMFSRYENSPCTIIEALSAGIPVIATNVGGIAEIVDAGNGMLVPSEDITALSRAMEHMIQISPAFQRKAIAEKAKALFSYESVGKQIADLYNEFPRI